MTLASFDWLLTAGVLYAFMPAHQGLSPFVVAGAFLIAQTVAVSSHVPAGAGIFEITVMTLLLAVAPDASRASIVVALLLYRVCYYLVPLGTAIVIAAVTYRHGAPRAVNRATDGGGVGAPRLPLGYDAR